jgi:hypothetical protein
MNDIPRFAAQWLLSEILRERFPGWEIEVSRLGMWNATRTSDNGRTTYYVITFTCEQLTERLSDITFKGTSLT